MSPDLIASPLAEPDFAHEDGLDARDRGLRPRERVRPSQPNEFRTPRAADAAPRPAEQLAADRAEP